MVQTYISIIENMEVRRVEEIEKIIKAKDKNIKDIEDRYLEVGFDDIDCNRLVFKDKDMSRANFYKRGMIGTLALQTTTEFITKYNENGKPYTYEKTSTIIHDFFPNENNKDWFIY